MLRKPNLVQRIKLNIELGIKKAIVWTLEKLDYSVIVNVDFTEDGVRLKSDKALLSYDNCNGPILLAKGVK